MNRTGHYLFTSESVAKGHPDKLCDQISDLILDAYLREDPESHTGIEVLATTNRVIIAGEVKGPSYILKDIEGKIRHHIQTLGYDQEGFHHEKLAFHNFIHAQSPDIARGVDRPFHDDEGAGDQGIMFGFACLETDTLMPAALYWSHRILEQLESLRHSRYPKELGPDAKSQVTLSYENGKVIGAQTIVLSTQHHPDVSIDDVRSYVVPMIKETLPEGWCTDQTEFLINPTGRFVIGGPDGDTGLTGRKIIVDTYGGAAPHGGGAFSGKDPTKVDRSAAYMARYLAKNIVAAGIADRCLLQLSYGIGIARPLSLYVDFEGTGRVPEERVEKAILDHFPLTPYSIRSHLNLNRPIYLPTASFGHFGRLPSEEGHFSWEKCDCVEIFHQLLS